MRYSVCALVENLLDMRVCALVGAQWLMAVLSALVKRAADLE
jgi:hypothetical protein